MEHSQDHRAHMQENSILSIIGEKVALGPIRRDLVPLYHRWINDFAVLRTLHIPRPSTFEEVQAAQHAYARAGFREIGRRRQAKFMAGKLWDIMYMDCLSTEFVSPVLRQILVPDEPRL